MTPPRFIEPGQRAFLSVRAVNRSFRFVPVKRVTETLRYCLAASMARFEGRISLHEFLFMSNHFHVVLTDEDGCLPDFTTHFHALVSRSLNALRGFMGSNIEKGHAIVVPEDDERLLPPPGPRP